MSLAPDLDAALSGQWKNTDYPDSDFGRIDHEKLRKDGYSDRLLARLEQA